MKTALALGNLCEEPLIQILDSLAGVPAYEPITMGHPERMGLARSWDEAKCDAASLTTLPDGRPYQNLCIGCDRFHEQVLGPVPARARCDAARGISLATAPRRRTVAIHELSSLKD